MNVDRARGALLGQAVGDALGTTLEFTTPRVAPFPTLVDGPHRDVTGGGPFRVAPGQVTDDTHMACCLAASLKAHGRFEAADVARRYVAWSHHTFDIGSTTRGAVDRLAAGDLEAGRRLWEERGRKVAANGSLMRTSPIGVFFWSDPGARRAAALADSALTHFDPRCRLACAALDGAIGLAIAGDDGDPIEQAEAELDAAARLLVDEEPGLVGTIRAGAADLLEDLRLARAADPRLVPLMHDAEGFVRVAFRLAFWELHHAPTFEAGLLDCVNRGGDADTNGAIAGALLGARHGAAAIRPSWCQRVLEPLDGKGGRPMPDEYHPRVLLELL